MPNKFYVYCNATQRRICKKSKPKTYIYAVIHRQIQCNFSDVCEYIVCSVLLNLNFIISIIMSRNLT